ncbi:MAG: alpha-L-fucosidase [Lentisphaeria bacterium]
MSFQLPFRQIHLDFHTGPGIPDVGAEFDADAFADQLAAAHVNSVTLFAKCHHGHLYYNTRHPARHPGLRPGLDLLGKQIAACHRRDIRAPIYLSTQCDEFAATTHPEWRVVTPDGRLAGSPLDACWHLVDMSSPYQDYLADQLAEVLKQFSPVDGIFLDMCWDQPSLSTWALAGMRRAGLDPLREADRMAYAHQVALDYMTRYQKLAVQLTGNPDLPIMFNSRPLWNVAAEKQFLRHVEIEALPTGDCGYMYFPLNVRYVRTFGLPTLGMTARFHKSWADFGGLKPQAALMYECCQMLAHGTCCSVGDQLHPRGVLDAGAYDLIGSVYRHVEACEPWCAGAVPVTDIAVIRVPATGFFEAPGNANEGAVRALTQLKQQFDLIPAGNAFDAYRVVVVPEGVDVTPDLAARLKHHVAKGGAVLFSGSAGFTADHQPVLGARQGAVCTGESPFTTTYLRFTGSLAAGIAANTDHAMYERGRRLTPVAGATGLVHVVEPYFERSWEHFCSHAQTPGRTLSPYVAAVRKGRVVTSAFPLFKAYGTHGSLACRHLIGKLLELLLPEPLLRVTAPSFVEATVTRQPKRHVVHLLSYAPVRRAPGLDIVEEASWVKAPGVALRLPKPPQRVTLQPEGVPLPCRYHRGYAEVTLPELAGHAMLVFED